MRYWLSLREKCLNTEFFQVCYSGIWTEYGDLLRKISLFSPNTGKDGPEKNSVFGRFLRILRRILKGDMWQLRSCKIATN